MYVAFIDFEKAFVNLPMRFNIWKILHNELGDPTKDCQLNHHLTTV